MRIATGVGEVSGRMIEEIVPADRAGNGVAPRRSVEASD